MIAPFPEFSWSHSRDRIFRACRREYYWQYYASHGGWLADAPNLAQLAYALKQLTTFELELGASVHRAAAKIAYAIRDGQERPEPEVLAALVRADLNALHVRSQDIRTFQLRPKQHPIARTYYYGSELTERRKARLEEKLEACIKHLVSAPVWDDVSSAGQDGILVIDELFKFVWDLIGIWVAPDLVYRSNEGTTTLVDWKTGKLIPDLEQLGLYGLFAREVLEIDPPYQGRLVGLQDGIDVVHEISAQALAAAEERVCDSVLRMETHVVDPATNQPLPLEHFPLAEDRRRCDRCSYLALCRTELNR